MLKFEWNDGMPEDNRSTRGEWGDCSLTVTKKLIREVTNDGLKSQTNTLVVINPLNAELNPICHLLALLGAHHILHVRRISVT